MSQFYEFPYNETDHSRSERLKDRTAEMKGRTRGRMDIPFFLLTLVILVVGLVMLLSASFASSYYDTYNPATGEANATYYFIRQAVFSVIGVAAMLIVSKIRIGFIRKYSFWLLVITVLLLLAVLLKGLTAKGAERWLGIEGVFTFQPSEIAKLAVVLSFASWICAYGNKMKTFKYGVLPFAITLGILSALLLMQPHLSATIIILMLGAVMMFVGGTRAYYFLIAIAAVWLGFRFVVGQPQLAEKGGFFQYAFERITAWQDPESVIRTSGWQIMQSLYAIGSGGLLGLGFGQSRQKYMYLPEEHNDYIFSIICEELGFIGASLILLLFAVLIIRGFWLALHCRDKYSRLVVVGITAMLTIQVFLNVGVVTNLLPSTGISLPFFSYGGTALCIQMAEMGIILSISRDIPDK